MNLSDVPHDEIQATVVEALANIAPQATPIDADSRLMGSGAVIDSIGFVNLLVTLEQMLPCQVDLAASYMEHTDVDESQNPFQTVGRLVRHICQLSSEQS